MAKTPSYHMKSRMVIVLVGMVVLGFCVVLHQLFKLQIIDGATLQGYALQQQLRTMRIGAIRGTIYDTSGKKALATSANVWSVCVAPGQIPNEEKSKDVIVCLNQFLGLDKEFVQKKLDRKKSLYEVVKTKVEKPDADALMKYVNENGLTSMIFLEEDTRRYYPYGNFASMVLGFTNSDNQGAYGLESHYEKILAGTSGRVVSLKNSRGVDIDRQYSQRYDAKNGDSIVLTIDETIQHYLEKNLEIAIAEHKVRNYAVGIVMNVKTGEILAMATKPDFDPNNPNEILGENAKKKLEELNFAETKDEYNKALYQAQLDQWRNRAISDPYEPGSVFKIVTASGALESGAVTQQSTFDCLGYVTVNGTPYHCWYWAGHHAGHGRQTLEQTIMNSCNPAFIDIGQRMGAKAFYEYFQNFGLTEETDIDLPGEAGSVYHSTYTINDLSSSSFGQTFKITPIQMITAVSAAVNGGKLMQPYIVKQVIDSEGNVVSTTEPVVKRQVISEDISRQMRGMLEQVVENGSGKNAKIPGYRVGGKTGTSEQLDNRDKETGRTPNTLSFYGFAPADDPQIGCLVLLDDPDIYNAFGSTIAAPIVGQVLSEVLPYMGIEPQYTEKELENIATSTPNVTSPPLDIHDAMAKIRIAGLKFRVVGNGTQVLRQMPGVAEPISKDGVVVLYTEEENAGALITVPDVVGKSSADANTAIVGAGLNVSFVGDSIEGAHNTATAQSPTAGEQVQPGTTVTVTLTASDPPPPA